MSQGESAKAIEILAPLATAGNLASQHNLAMVYAAGGAGVEKDFDKALVWYRAATKLRFIPSIHNLGVMYQLGQAVQVDYARALQLYLLAGQFGYAPALASAAYVFAKGLGRPAQRKGGRLGLPRITVDSNYHRELPAHLPGGKRGQARIGGLAQLAIKHQLNHLARRAGPHQP